VLTAFAVDALEKVTLAIEQANADKGQVQVTGRFAMVAGENAEAAGIDRQAFVEAELGAKIGDQAAFWQMRAMLAPWTVVIVVVCR
jgi:hypothetical protein